MVLDLDETLAAGWATGDEPHALSGEKAQASTHLGVQYTGKHRKPVERPYGQFASYTDLQNGILQLSASLSATIKPDDAEGPGATLLSRASGAIARTMTRELSASLKKMHEVTLLEFKCDLCLPCDPSTPQNPGQMWTRSAQDAVASLRRQLLRDLDDLVAKPPLSCLSAMLVHDY